MGLGRRGRFFRLSGPAAQHIVGKPRTALGIDRETKFRSPPQDIVGFQRPFFRHYPIDYGGIEHTAEIPPKIRLFVGRIGDRPRSRSVTPRDRAATINRMPENRRPTHRRNTRSHPPHRPSATLLLSTGPAYSKSGRGVCYDGFDKLTSRRYLTAEKTDQGRFALQAIRFDDIITRCAAGAARTVVVERPHVGKAPNNTFRRRSFPEVSIDHVTEIGHLACGDRRRPPIHCERDIHGHIGRSDHREPILERNGKDQPAARRLEVMACAAS